MDSSSHISFVLRLNTQTRGWEKSMHRLLKDIRGVTYTIDAMMGLGYVSGKMSPEIILRIGKCKKHVQIIYSNYAHNVVPRSLSYNLPTINRFNQPQPLTPMFQTGAQPYMYYRQIPYGQPRVAYPYFYHHRSFY